MKFVDKILEKFSNLKVDCKKDKPRRVYIEVPKEIIKDVVKYVFFELEGRLCTCTGIDRRAYVEVLYHFGMDREKTILTLRVFTEKPEMKIDSVADEIPAFIFIEREISELIGVNFVGHPKMKGLLLSSDWPQGKYPLRRVK